MKFQDANELQPVVRDVADFDQNTGSLGERVLFNYRGMVLAVCLVVTAVLGYQATTLKLNASYEKTIPTGHPYIANYLKHQGDLAGLGNAVRIAVETTGKSIYDTAYMQTLQELSDELFLLPGVDRVFMKSLWTPSTRWFGVTEEGFEGGPVVPNEYDGSAVSMEQLRQNVARSGEIGQLVAQDHRSSVIFVPLLAINSKTGEPLDYGAFSEELEALRNKYQSDTVKIHITGFAKVVGDLIAGVRQILVFFAVAVFISAGVLFWYTRCTRSTLVVVACALVGVVWQLGLSAALGYELDPYSVLVPFLVFAIAMSHGAQKMNGILQDIGRGTHKVVAARYTFRRLFLAGLTALLSDAVGFAVLMIIDIGVIRELALIASIGVAVIIFTNLILVPITLSYVGVSPAAATRSLRAEAAGRAGEEAHPIWRFLDLFTRRRWAVTGLVCGLVLAAGGYTVSRDLRIGDLDPGAPELRPDSRYNQDNAYVRAHYGATSDVLAVMVETPPGACSAYDTLMRIDALEWDLRQLQGVESTNSLALMNRRMATGFNEGSLKWYALPRNQHMLNTITGNAPRGLYNDTCDLLTLYAYLKDHKADTLTLVVETVEAFAGPNQTENATFLLGAGTAGIEAATNIVVKKANREMLFWVYGAVILLCFLTFRSWRAVVCAVLPLMLTSILAEALMVFLGIGVKVATLPVIALGVGIGVDYALYVLSVTLGHLKAGHSLSESYYRSLLFTGKVVMLIGVTLSVSVATWVFSPIKFQADMGIMLAFMFLWNMLGTLILLPALACFLLPQNSTPSATAATENESAPPVTIAREPRGQIMVARDKVPVGGGIGPQ
ncbi:MAG: MMPL family transporter [Deferrisomatales bacterium]|nr:MMPL family transporter [Deferrisomatales bacterium]